MPKDRLGKITTKTGDQGQTGLGSGRRVPKQHIRIAVIGDADELNSALGCVMAALTSVSPLHDDLLLIQHQLFNVGGELAMDGEMTLVTQADVEWLEKKVETWNESLPALKEFILPSGSMAIAQCHLARSICRRVERQCCALAEQESVSDILLVYLNRLSDCLFVLGRIIAKEQGVDEVYWHSARLQRAISSTD